MLKKFVGNQIEYKDNTDKYLSTKRSYVLGTRRREMQNIVHENVSKNQAKKN